jgi:hypothetical protein
MYRGFTIEFYRYNTPLFLPLLTLASFVLVVVYALKPIALATLIENWCSSLPEVLDARKNAGNSATIDVRNMYEV